jgi:hypothetical protein
MANNTFLIGVPDPKSRNGAHQLKPNGVQYAQSLGIELSLQNSAEKVEPQLSPDFACVCEGFRGLLRKILRVGLMV